MSDWSGENISTVKDETHVCSEYTNTDSTVVVVGEFCLDPADKL